MVRPPPVIYLELLIRKSGAENIVNNNKGSGFLWKST